ncbi:MAG: flagellar export chaperone FliS [Deltaproteobacteria bacterium]|nr:flagellar export chaperone FliS [Deltaproteobacteria bacterium]
MNKVNQYQKVQVMTADRVRLIIMLYDGVLKFNKCAQRAIKEGDIESRSTYINRSLAIIGELKNSLNMEEGGEIALNLSRLYDFSIEKLAEANLKNDASAVDAVTLVINELKSGWEGIAAAQKPQAGKNIRESAGISNGI